MPSFHKLKIKDIKRETPDCVSISFDIPQDLKSEFDYKQGQYLTLRLDVNGEEIRRSYSACSSPVVDDELRIAVKKVENGRASTYLNNGIEIGTAIDVMKPMGNFYTEMPASSPKHYVAFAAGSGITPIMSLLKTALAVDENNKFTLFYGNRDTESIIFKDELDEIEKNNPGRFKVVHILSREETADPLFKGRITVDKCKGLFNAFPEIYRADEYFLCGPYDMITSIQQHLEEAGKSKESIHYELFSTPDAEEAPEVDKSDDEGDFTESKVTIVLDGDETEITVPKGEVILDAALDAGLDAPYACTGGSCCTCRAKVMEGAVEMEVNYALTDQEVEDGYVLTCQSHPTTPTMIVDYDEP